MADASGVESDDLGLLLDRLEQVRVEDYDARPGWGPFEDRLRRAKRENDAQRRRKHVEGIIARGLELFGLPEEAETVSDIEIAPERLTLVSWEWLEREPVVETSPEQTSLPS